MTTIRKGEDLAAAIDRINAAKAAKYTPFAEAVERINAKKRGKGRLDAAATRDKIGVSIAEAVPTGATPGTGSGPISPLVEQPYAGSTFLNWVSSDGLFVFEYGDQTEYLDNGGVGASYIYEHI